eukprot:4413582-Pyramimonas_sp.AAC.1
MSGHNPGQLAIRQSPWVRPSQSGARRMSPDTPNQTRSGEEANHPVMAARKRRRPPCKGIGP